MAMDVAGNEAVRYALFVSVAIHGTLLCQPWFLLTYPAHVLLLL